MTFEKLMDGIKSLSIIGELDFFVAGRSLLGKPIYGVHIGPYDGKQILFEGGIHAREWASSLLVVDLVKFWAGKILNGGIYFIPLSNPDGVQLALSGADAFKCEKQRDFLLNVNDGNSDFSLWKANANAVDLNVNFDALWGGGAQNVFCPAPGNFVGYYANSEREVDSLIAFTQKNKPSLTISYHTKGEVIYWGFETLSQAQLERDKKVLEKLVETTGYQPIKTVNSTGGYSDWVSVNLQVPAFTIELGNAKIPHPVGAEYVPVMFEQNKFVPQVALQCAIDLNL